MPTDLVNRLNLDELYPPFLEKVLEVLAACRARGADYVATRGFATYQEQDILFMQGRTIPGKIVTGARGGESPHCFGLAIDLCRDGSPDPGLQMDWNPAHYELLGEEARRAGLVWGGDWLHLKDRPHIQWPGYVHAKDMGPLRHALEVGWLPAVWAHLDSEGKVA